MKYYIIAGEASGDLHASNLMKALKEENGAANFRVWGGDLMEAAGGKLVKHYRDLAFMGFIEVVQNLRTILNNIKFCKKDILEYQPDVLILVDYPGFNLRIAKWAKKQGIKVFYYISPQIWAWNSKRVHQIKKDIDRMFVILPFEKDFYKKYDMDVDFVGHPLLDVVHDRKVNSDFKNVHELSEKPNILKNSWPKVKVVQNKTYDLLQLASAALVTSGTATLETGLFKVPQVVCYKGSTLSYSIAKRLVNVKYISLVNLILDRPLVKELIQTDFNPENLNLELKKVLEDSSEIKQGYLELEEKLGTSGASKKAAKLMCKLLTEVT